MQCTILFRIKQYRARTLLPQPIAGIAQRTVTHR
jgi:hypothetical protein